MSVEGIASQPVRFAIGRTLKDSLNILARNFLVFVTVAAALRLLFLLLPPIDAQAILSATRVDWWDSVLQLSIGFLVGGVTKALIVFGTIQTLRGGCASVATVWHGIRFVPLVVIAGVVMGLPSIAATVTQNLAAGSPLVVATWQFVFAAATLALILMWWIYAPVIVAEECGLRQALRRSRQLLTGRRWKVVGLLLIVGVTTSAVVFAIAAIGGVELAQLTTFATMTPIGIALFAVGALLTAFNDVVVTVAYHHLRIEKEGSPPETVVQVFD